MFETAIVLSMVAAFSLWTLFDDGKTVTKWITNIHNSQRL